MNKPIIKILVVHESVLASIAKDTFSFAVMGLLFWFNYTKLGDNTAINLIFVVLLFAQAMPRISKSVHTFYSYESARKYVNGDKYEEK